MYHDQALIPIKTLTFDKGVNVTLGLPFVRTSPDHGTAFDIAGTGTADPRACAALAGRAAGGERAGARAREIADGSDRRPAAAARRHRRHGLRRRNRWARISCSISISPRASRAPAARSTA